MSDNPSRGGSRKLLSGLAMGAVLAAPIAPITTAGAEETSAAAVEQVAPGDSCPANLSIREQFRASFAAGAIAPPATDSTAVIC